MRTLKKNKVRNVEEQTKTRYQNKLTKRMMRKCQTRRRAFVKQQQLSDLVSRNERQRLYWRRLTCIALNAFEKLELTRGKNFANDVDLSNCLKILGGPKVQLIIESLVLHPKWCFMSSECFKSFWDLIINWQLCLSKHVLNLHVVQYECF